MYTHFICPSCGEFRCVNGVMPICRSCEVQTVTIYEKSYKKTYEYLKSLSSPELAKYLTDIAKQDSEDGESDIEIAVKEYYRQRFCYNSKEFNKEKYDKRIRELTRKKQREHEKRQAQSSVSNTEVGSSILAYVVFIIIACIVIGSIGFLLLALLVGVNNAYALIYGALLLAFVYVLIKAITDGIWHFFK